jgi:hypothetical protein
MSAVLATYPQPLVSQNRLHKKIAIENQNFVESEFDSDNITVTLLTPAINSTVVGMFNIALNVTSDNGPLNLSLFVEDELYEDYNKTPIGIGTNWIQNITVNSTLLPEGNLNFTMLFEENHTGILQRETLRARFVVNNQGLPSVELLAPEINSVFTGLSNLTLNISVEVFVNTSLTNMTPRAKMNVTVDGEITPEYNSTPVSVGVENYTINASRYENGEHSIEIIVFTEEYESSSEYAVLTNITLIFLDHIRFVVTGLTNFDEISGDAEINVKIFTPYDNVTLSVYVDDILTDDVVNVTLIEGVNAININTTGYSEGEHAFTFKAYDAFGHKWTYIMILVVNNHGVPLVQFTEPDEDIVVGLTNFTIKVNSTWDFVNITVYVDDEIVSGYNELAIAPGIYTFTIDTSNYSKWEHVVRVVISTEEGESAEAESTFGFANFKIEEIISLAILLSLAILIPLFRWRKGMSIRPVLIADFIFILAAAAIFLVLGVNTLPLIVWHLNLASIWIMGVAIVFINWAILFIYEESEE